MQTLISAGKAHLMTLEYPDRLTEHMTECQKNETQQWWNSLTDDAQQNFILMWDERAEDSAYYGFVEENKLVWEALPLELFGEFVEHDLAEMEHDLFKQQLLEFINNHEDIQFFMIEGRFHICRAHPQARQVVLDGLLPATFTCPLEKRQCPMLRILSLAPGKSVRFCPRVASPMTSSR